MARSAAADSRQRSLKLEIARVTFGYFHKAARAATRLTNPSTLATPAHQHSPHAERSLTHSHFGNSQKKYLQKVEKFHRPKSSTQITTIHHQSTTNSPQIHHQKAPHFHQPPSKTPAKTTKIHPRVMEGAAAKAKTLHGSGNVKINPAYPSGRQLRSVRAHRSWC